MNYSSMCAKGGDYGETAQTFKLSRAIALYLQDMHQIHIDWLKYVKSMKWATSWENLFMSYATN